MAGVAGVIYLEGELNNVQRQITGCVIREISSSWPPQGDVIGGLESSQ